MLLRLPSQIGGSLYGEDQPTFCSSRPTRVGRARLLDACGQYLNELAKLRTTRIKAHRIESLLWFEYIAKPQFDRPVACAYFSSSRNVSTAPPAGSSPHWWQNPSDWFDDPSRSDLCRESRLILDVVTMHRNRFRTQLELPCDFLGGLAFAKE